MSVQVTQPEINVREELSRIVPPDQNPNFASVPLVQGVPILESGSNANGNWIKYEDGTMIQVVLGGSHDITVATTYSFYLTLPIPLVFPSEGAVSVNTVGEEYQKMENVRMTSSVVATNGTQVRVVICDPAYTFTQEINSLVVGRWK